MKDDGYRIVDEPRSGPLSGYAINPIFPFIALMMFPLLGAALCLFNALALRSRTMWAEVALLAAAVGVRQLGPALLANAYLATGAPAGSYRYALAVPIGAALYLGYRLFMLQATAYELKTYYAQPRQRS